MIVVGVDLSGPSNTDDTALVIFRGDPHSLQLDEYIPGATDEVIFQASAKYQLDDVFIGIDAPLSYNPGGGSRPSDISLRKQIIAKGMRSGSVMAPTFNKMAYLTLRGLGVARLLDTVRSPDLNVVEVHPGAAMALGIADVGDVRSFKTDISSRLRMLNWMDNEGLKGVAKISDPSDHYVAACACALAAWKWAKGESVWLYKACAPYHPYDFAC